MPSTKENSRTRKPTGYDPATLLVQLLHEYSIDVGPESQKMHIIMPSWDTYAYTVTTFLVNGYEVKQSAIFNAIDGTKAVNGIIQDDGWRLDLWVYNVPIASGEIEAAQSTDDITAATGGGADKQEGPVPRRRIPRGTRPDESKTSPPPKARTRRPRTSDSVLAIGEA